MQGWVDLVGWLHTEMVYPPKDGHPSQYSLGPTWVNFVHATNAANHYATLWWVCVCVCLSACISETASANFTHFCAVYVWSWLGRPLAALQYVNFWLSGWRQLCKYWLERGNKKGIYSKWLTRWQHQLNAMVHAKTWLSRRQRQIRGGICVMSITALWLLILINDKN